MEAALHAVLQKTFGEYVNGLENVDTSNFPVTLRNLGLKEKRIQEEMDEDGSCPFDLTEGSIGSITLTPGWMGSLEVVATNISLKLSFNPMKAMNAAMRPAEQEEYYDHSPYGNQQFQNRGPPQPPPPVPPRYCCNHDSSEKRVKGEPVLRECTSCHMRLQTSYADFCLCPQCSESQKRCMLCGDSAPVGGTYIPQTSLANGPGQQGHGGGGPPCGPDRARSNRRGGGAPFADAGVADRDGPPFPNGNRGGGGQGQGESFSSRPGGGQRPPPPPPMMDGRGGGPDWGDNAGRFGGPPGGPGGPGGKGGRGGYGGKGEGKGGGYVADMPNYQTRAPVGLGQPGFNPNTAAPGMRQGGPQGDDDSGIPGFLKMLDFRQWGNCHHDGGNNMQGARQMQQPRAY